MYLSAAYRSYQVCPLPSRVPPVKRVSLDVCIETMLCDGFHHLKPCTGGLGRAAAAEWDRGINEWHVS